MQTSEALVQDVSPIFEADDIGMARLNAVRPHPARRQYQKRQSPFI
jgi:hypothetical protein